MVALVTFSQVRTRLSLPDDEGVKKATVPAIASATPLLESALGTMLSTGSAVDQFNIPYGFPKSKGMFVIRLSSGFLRTAPTITYGSSLQLIAENIMDMSECLVKSELGHIYVPSTYEEAYLQVSYTYGFDDGDETIPQWLSEAAMMKTIAMLSAQQIGDPKPELSEVFKHMADSSATILNAHLRGNSFTINPL